MLYQREETEMQTRRMQQDPGQVHCYTNPSFCRQSEYIPEDPQGDATDLPPPPQFQMDDLPPPPAMMSPQPSQYGQTNPAFHGSPETELSNHPEHHRSIASNLNRTTADRYCYIDEPAEEPSPPPVISHKRYGSLPLGNRNYAYRANRYEYIQDPPVQQLQHQQQQPPPPPQQLQQQQQPPQHVVHQVNNATRYIEHQQMQQRSVPSTPQQSTPQQQIMMTPTRSNSVRVSSRSYRSADTHYASLGPDGAVEATETQWIEEDTYNTSRRQINTPKGRYTSLPMQEEYPPNLPERNDTAALQQQQRLQQVNQATQKLHEILTTPRKPRKRSASQTMSPIKSPHMQPMLHGLQRNVNTPTHSPSSVAGYRATSSPMQHPQSRDRTMSPSRHQGPATSTPNKEPPPHPQQQQQPTARRCLTLNESAGAPMIRRHIEDSQAYGRVGSPGRGYVDSVAEEAMYVERKKPGFYPGVEGAFIARTAVVPPLSPPPMSEANTTLVSGTEKSDRKNAPLLLVMVGVLTCGLAIYLSNTQGRRYYFDSAIGCGALCALAGASRSLRRTWTGLGLAGLAALSCAGLLLLAVKSPRPGTPVHDVTAGALCGVSLLGAALAFLALLSPRCTFGRHRRVHSWIPAYQP